MAIAQITSAALEKICDFSSGRKYASLRQETTVGAPAAVPGTMRRLFGGMSFPFPVTGVLIPRLFCHSYHYAYFSALLSDCSYGRGRRNSSLTTTTVALPPLGLARGRFSTQGCRCRMQYDACLVVEQKQALRRTTLQIARSDKTARPMSAGALL